MARRRQRVLDAVIDQIGIPDPWDLDDFTARISAYTGREVRVMPPVQAVPGGPCGLYVSTNGADYIYTTHGATPFHRELILLHEVGHLVLGHDGGLSQEDMARLLAPGLSTDMIRFMLGRAAYGSSDERDAEEFATRVMERAVSGRRPAALTPDPIEDAFGRPVQDPGARG